MSRLVLVACSDDYLLEERLGEVVAEASAELGDAEVGSAPEDATPESVAMDLMSPSLFSARRVVVVPGAAAWVDAPPPPGQPASRGRPDVAPLAATLAEGLPDDVALVLAAWCGGKPKGPLVETVEKAGRLEWISLPPPPKPWEQVELSGEQRRVLERVLARSAGGCGVTPAARELLMERLGFAPRLLAQETRKLVTAAGQAGEVDEDLVRQLVFPRERSLEKVRDAVLRRQPAVLVDLLAAASSGVPLSDWRGQRVEPANLGPILLGQVTSLLLQLRYLRSIADAAGLGAELDPGRVGEGGWYPRVFKTRLAPALERALDGTGPSPLARRGKPPSTWTLGQLFEGAARFGDDELERGLVEAAAVEVALRGSLGLEAVSAWLVRLMQPRQRAGRASL